MGIFDWLTPSRISETGTPLPPIPVEIYEEIFSYIRCPESYLFDCESKEAQKYRNTFTTIALVCRYFSACALSRLYRTIRLSPNTTAGWPSFTPFCRNLIAASIKTTSSLKRVRPTKGQLTLGPLLFKGTPSETELKMAQELSPLVKVIILTNWEDEEDERRTFTGFAAGFLKNYFKAIALLPNVDTLVLRNTTVDDTLLGLFDTLPTRTRLHITTFHTVDCDFNVRPSGEPLLPNVTEMSSRANSQFSYLYNPHYLMSLFDLGKLSRLTLHDESQLECLLEDSGEDLSSVEHLTLRTPDPERGETWDLLPQLIELLPKLKLKSLQISGLLVSRDVTESLHRQKSSLPSLRSASIPANLWPVLPQPAAALTSLTLGPNNDETGAPLNFDGALFAHAKSLRSLGLTCDMLREIFRLRVHVHFAPFVALESLHVLCYDNRYVTYCLDQLNDYLELALRHTRNAGGNTVERVDASLVFPALKRVKFDFGDIRHKHLGLERDIKDQKRRIAELAKHWGTLREVDIGGFVWRCETAGTWYCASDTAS